MGLPSGSPYFAISQGGTALFKIETPKIRLAAGAPFPSANQFQTFAEDLHRMGFAGQGVIINVVDSGAPHPEQVPEGALIGGLNLAPGGDPADLLDRLGHGSLVTRIVLAIAPKAQIRTIRIFGDQGYCEDATAGLGLQKASEAGHLTNASIGGDANPALALGVAMHEGKQMPLIAAAGNTSLDKGSADIVERSYPGAYEYVTAIGAIDHGGMPDTGTMMDWLPWKPSEFSSSYPEVDAVAVGRVPGSWDMGTSFAAPIAAGLEACYISYAMATGRDWSDDACYLWLTSNARQLPGLPARNDQTGYGQLTLRPYQTPVVIEIDVETLEVYVSGVHKPELKGQFGLENRAPGGVYGWYRPLMEAAGAREVPVEYDDGRRRARYKF